MSLFKRAEKDLQSIFSEYYKTAEEFNIGDQPEGWQTNIANVALENNPYLSNYAVDVMLDKVDGDRGSGYGNITIRNKVEDNNINDVKSIKVPIIVQDNKLKPLDIMNDGGKIFPLSEEKLVRYRIDTLVVNQHLHFSDTAELLATLTRMTAWVNSLL